MRTATFQPKNKVKHKVPVGLQKSKEDIIQLILADHKPLKTLLKVLKNPGQHNLRSRKSTFEQFARLLLLHTKAEQESFYVFLKDEDKRLRVLGLEGDTEHGLVEQMVFDAKNTTEPDLWTAKTKVLAEFVEHHLDEEEETIFPHFKKESDLEDRILIGKQYLDLKAHFKDEKTFLTVEEEEAIEGEKNRDYRPASLMQ